MKLNRKLIGYTKYFFRYHDEEDNISLPEKLVTLGILFIALGVLILCL